MSNNKSIKTKPNNEFYPLINEIIITSNDLKCIKLGEKKGYISISRDGSEITYRATSKTYGFKRPEEKIRAYFLIKLIEKYKYTEKRIQFDVEVPGYKITHSAGLVVYKGLNPYIVIEFRKENISRVETEKTKDEVIDKAEKLKAEYAVAVIGFTQKVFQVKVKEKPIEILDIPIKYER